MKPKRVSVEDNARAVKLASSTRSVHSDTQDIVDKDKPLSQRAENRPLVQRSSVLDGPAPHGSGFGTRYKDKYPAGVFNTRVAKYLARQPDLAKGK